MAETDLIGHYRIIERIGAGGMGEVVRARDTKLDRDVALKLLPQEFMADPDRHARFHREARSMAAFSHPHVAAIHAFEEVDGRHFLVMELVEGQDLAHHLRQGPLPVDRALPMAHRIALGLEAAHAAGIVHRDLKPGNVMLTEDDDIKLLDFGLAKVFDPDTASTPGLDDPTLTSARTLEGVVLGTAAYMSPEQARGRAVDRQADIWALGAVVFEMVTGQRAFQGETVTDTLAAVLRSEPPWEALPAGLPPELVRLMRRCLQKDPRRRLHDVADARIVLEELESGSDLHTSADPGSAPAGDEPGPRRRLAAIGLVLLAVVLAAAGAAWLRPTALPQPPREEILTYSGRDWSPAAAPGGGVIAFVSDRDGTPRIWLKQLAGGSETPLTTGPDDLPRFSPDGSQILFVRDIGQQRDLYRVPALGGTPRKTVNNVREGDWSPDGTQVAFIRPGEDRGQNLTHMGIANLQSGDERVLYSAINRLCYGVRWSPDGRWISLNETSLTGNSGGSSGILLIQASDGTVREFNLTETNAPYGAVAWAPSGQAMVVGQAVNLLSHVMGKPGLIMESPTDSPRARAVAWSPLRLPRGGRGFSTLAVLDRNTLVTDHSRIRAELHEVSLDGTAGPGTRVVTRGLSRDRQPSYSPDGDRIIFSSNRSGNVDLWIVDPATGDLRQQTDDEASDWDPAFTPAGDQVLWSTDRSGIMEIWIAAADGTGARQVTQDGWDAENPSMTSDGQWIVYASGHPEKIGIWKIRPDGSDATRLSVAPHLLPELSPDGRYVLMVTLRGLDARIEVYDLQDERLLPFGIDVVVSSRNEDLVFGRARWTPNGRSVVFVGQNADGRSGIFIQDFEPEGDTLATRRPLAGFSPQYSTESLDISPDGRFMTISATYDQRTLKVVNDLDLKLWR